MKTLICHGDSLTEGPDLDAPYRWPSLVENKLGIRVANTGIGGDTTGGMLARFYPDVVQAGPDFVLLLGGTNDLWWGLDTGATLGNIFSMACQAQYHGIEPIIATPLPVDTVTVRETGMMMPVIGLDALFSRLPQLTETLVQSAGASDIPVIDMYRLFIDASGMVDRNLFLEDGLHPNKAGHELMARETAGLMSSRFGFNLNP